MTVALFGGNNLILIEGAEVDGKQSELHGFSAAPTNFAIEDGSNSTDHIVEQPDKLTIKWVMSNLDDQGASYGNRAALLLETLRLRIKERKLWQVVTRHRLYPSMAVVDVQAEHTGPFTGALRGTIGFQEVPLDKLERVKVPAAQVKRKSASSQVNSGRVEPKEPTAPQRSVLSQLFGK